MRRTAATRFAICRALKPSGKMIRSVTGCVSRATPADAPATRASDEAATTTIVRTSTTCGLRISPGARVVHPWAPCRLLAVEPPRDRHRPVGFTSMSPSSRRRAGGPQPPSSNPPLRRAESLCDSIDGDARGGSELHGCGSVLLGSWSDLRFDRITGPISSLRTTRSRLRSPASDRQTAEERPDWSQRRVVALRRRTSRGRRY